MRLILDRYIRGELLRTLGGVTIVLYLIFLSNRLVAYLGDVASGSIPGSYLFVFIGLASVRYLIILAPLAFYIAVLLLLGRLYRDHEMAALSACGVGTRKIYRPVFFTAVPLSILIAVLSFYVVPHVADIEYQLRKGFEKNLEFTGISPGKFHQNKDYIVYLESLSEDQTRMENVFIQSQKSGRNVLIIAETAYMQLEPDTGNRLLVLVNGARYEGVPGQTDFKYLSFARHSLLLAVSKDQVRKTDTYSMLSMDLVKMNSAASWAELQWRAAIPLSILLLALLAVPLAKIPPRKGQFGRLFVGVLIYVLYVNLLAVSKAWIAKEKISPEIGLNWVHLLILILAIFMLARQFGFRRIKAMLIRRVEK